MTKYWMVGLGGFVGSIARFWLGGYIGNRMGARTSYGSRGSGGFGGFDSGDGFGGFGGADSGAGGASSDW